MAEDTVKASGYLVIRGKRPYWNDTAPVTSARVTKARQSKPDSLGKDEIVVKVTVQLPKAAFDPLEPEALVVVPEELIQHPVTVEAVGPTLDNA